MLAEQVLEQLVEAAAVLDRAASGAPFLPTGEELRMLLEAFLLEKATYEVAYELNNRPAWVTLPLSGILASRPPEAP